MLRENLLRIAAMLTKEQKYSAAHDIETAVEGIAEQQERIKALRQRVLELEVQLQERDSL